VFETIAPALWVILGVVLSSAVYLWKRRIEKSRKSERLNRIDMLLTVNRKLMDQGIQPTELSRLEREILHPTRPEPIYPGFPISDIVNILRFLAIHSGNEYFNGKIVGMLGKDEDHEYRQNLAASTFHVAYGLLIELEPDGESMPTLSEYSDAIVKPPSDFHKKGR